MKLIVGLGNPGPKYETTRHNAGFLAADRLIENWKLGSPKTQNRGEIWTGSFKGEKIAVVKPQTFMNVSGQCVAPWVTFFKLEPTDLVVIHDELDVLPGKFRLKTGGGAGGHNGIKSIDECLGSARNGYHRVRIGIGHPRTLERQRDVADWVLEQFSDSELAELDPLLDQVQTAVEMIIQGQITEAMNRFHR
jgi:PTH1 family peptidyl-tRNA hydrolase